MIQDKHTIQYT